MKKFYLLAVAILLSVSILNAQKVIVVDDSIVRGTTSRRIVRMLKEAGAKEVHLRISSPPTIGACFYGVDTPDKDKLIASNMSVDEIFNKKKFDLIDDTTIQKYKNTCLQQLNEIKKQEEKAQQEMQKEQELRKKIENFKLQDCEKFANQRKFQDIKTID